LITALLWNLKQCDDADREVANCLQNTQRHTAEALLLYASGLPVFYENFELTQVQKEATWK